MNDSDYGKSIEIADSNIENDLNRGVLENGAEMAATIMIKRRALNKEIYTLITSKDFQDNYRYKLNI